ncbi:hypothetical protein DFH06DRAFT_1122186 [Mycena polygramma]|nr:hypothetical protein DFH06DRAFT_1122186 [Mycena polygramma]
MSRIGRGVTKRVGLGLPQSYGVGLSPMEVGLRAVSNSGYIVGMPYVPSPSRLNMPEIPETHLYISDWTRAGHKPADVQPQAITSTPELILTDATSIEYVKDYAKSVEKLTMEWLQHLMDASDKLYFLLDKVNGVDSIRENANPANQT